jgi:hypothetical protein
MAIRTQFALETEDLPAAVKKICHLSAAVKGLSQIMLNDHERCGNAPYG